MIFGTWNTQGLKGKIEDVVKELEKRGVDVAVLTETKRKGNGLENCGDFIHIYSGVPKSQRAAKGVSILIRKKYNNKITSWETINERLATLNLSLKGHRIVIIAAYGPNEDDTQPNKDAFYDQLNEILSRTGNQRETMVMGDLNARVGAKTDSNVVGRHGENILNNNGQRLIELCTQHKHKILNGFFQHKNIHKYTWHQETRQLKSVIDYIIIKQKSLLEVQDTRVYRGIECGSDHFFLGARIQVPFKTKENATDATETSTIKQIRYNVAGLHEPSTNHLFKTRLDSKLQTELLSGRTDELYEHITSCLHSAAQEALGIQPKDKSKRNNNITWNNTLEEQKQIKQKAYDKWLNTKDPQDKNTYKNEQSTFKNMINKNKNETWDRKCSELNTHMGGTRSSEAWKIVKSLRSDTTNKINLQPIPIEKWRLHYHQQLTEDRQKYLINSPRRYNVQGQHIDVTKEMTWRAIKSMKNGRAAGPEGIPAELLKNGTEKLNSFLVELFNRLLNNGDPIPTIWKEGWITPIHKKGKRDECSNYRCISVTSTLSRVYGKLLRNIIEAEYGPQEIEEQAGFRAGRSCVDHLFSLFQLNEKKVARNREVHLLFVDLTKAYDTVPIQKLWQVLENSPINNTAIQAIRQLYNQALSRIKIGNNVSETFYVTKGLRQGCCLSPTLFKIYLNEALKKWRKSCSGMGIELNNDTHLYTLHFADDQVAVAQDKEDLEFMARRLFKAYEEWGLSVNCSKTKYMCIGGEGTDLEIDDNTIVKSCSDYTYLGTKINQSGRTEEEILERIVKGKKVIGCLNSLLWSTNISKERKHLLYNTIFKSILLYGCETWQINKTLERKLLALEMDFWRRSAGKSRLERTTNDRIREIMDVKKTILDEIEQRQLIWYGHVERMADERLPKQILKWTPTERKKRGRPKTTWIAGINRAMSERNLLPGDWEDRKRWKLGTGRRRTL